MAVVVEEGRRWGVGEKNRGGSDSLPALFHGGKRGSRAASTTHVPVQKQRWKWGAREGGMGGEELRNWARTNEVVPARIDNRRSSTVQPTFSLWKQKRV